MNRNSFLLSGNGGVFHAVSPDGEFLFSVAVPPGKVSASEYLDLLPEGCEVKVEGLTVVSPRVLGGVFAPEALYESGANPDFQPTSASRLEVEMRQQIQQAQLLNRTLSARMAALSSVEAMPRSVKPEDISLVE